MKQSINKNMAALQQLAWDVMQWSEVYRPVSSVAEHIAVGAGSMEFDSLDDQIGHCVTNGSPPR